MPHNPVTPSHPGRSGGTLSTQQTIQDKTGTRGLSRNDALQFATLQKQFASDECKADRDELGARLHANNLRLTASYLHRKGLWRVRLNATCEVLEVVSGSRSGPPVPGEFSFKSMGGATMPSFGSLSRLDETQTTYAKSLIVDLEKVARAREVASQHLKASQAAGNGAAAEGEVKEYLESMTAKVGELPPSRLEVSEATRQQQAAAEEERRRFLEAEEREALVHLGVSTAGGAGSTDGGSSLTLDDVLDRERERERKKALKKARQRAKKQEAQRAQQAEESRQAEHAAEARRAEEAQQVEEARDP